MSPATFLALPSTRGIITEALTDTANVLRGSVTDDGGGGGTTVLGTAVADVRCRVDALGGREGEVADRLSDRSTHTITFPPGTDVTSADTVVISTDTYEITAVRSYTGELSRVTEAVKTP